MTDGFIRVFVALDIGDAVRKALVEEVRDLRKTHPRVKWVAPDNIHLTLAFLGDIPGERVGEIGKSLESVASGFEVFECSVKGLGWFGSPRSPRVVWAGMPENAELMLLQAGIAEALRQLGYTPEDRPFHPHLTLGRVKFSKDAAGLAGLLQSRADKEIGPFRVDRILTLRSELQPRGPLYSVLHEAALLPVNRG